MGICKGVNIPGMNINNQAYADENALLAENQECVQKLGDKFDVFSLTYNMKLHIKKTKTLVISGATITPARKISLGNEEVEQLKKCVYLGSQFVKKGHLIKEIIIRIEIANGVF